MMTIYRNIALFCLLALLLSGCAVYSFNPGGKSSIKSIAVTQFENKTIESGLSSRMTDLVVDAFIADGNLKVASESEADAVMVGVLSSYERKAYTFDEADIVSQYAVKLVFDITLKNGSDGSEIWKEAFYSEGVYAADDETEEDGQAKAAAKLVVDVLNRTTKDW